jgi:hypothetical protein
LETKSLCGCGLFFPNLSEPEGEQSWRPLGLQQ